MPYNPATDELARTPSDRSSPAVDVVQLTSGMVSDTVDLTTSAKAIRIYVPSTASGAVTVRVTPLLSSSDSASVPITVPPGGLSYEAISVRRIWSTGSANLFASGVEILLLRA